MKQKLLLILVFSIFFYSLNAQQFESKVALKCEYLSEPLGIDNPHPRLIWDVSDASTFITGTNFVVKVWDSDGKEIWNSAQLDGSKNRVVYDGKPLEPFTRYHWILIATHNSYTYPKEFSSSFETGMLQPRHWKGEWISDNIDIDLKPAPYFRKTFATAKSIKSARAYIAAAGLYELSINGNRIGDHRLDPMYTRFDRRNLYVTYDVTKELSSGSNTIGVLLGNGWYNHQSTAVWYFDKAPWRNRPTFCMDLRITYTDGSVETVSTDKSWKTHLSPVIFNSIYTAEHFDARLEIPGWNKNSFNDSAWKPSMERAAPSQKIVAQAMVPIRDVKKIPAKYLKKFNDTNYVFNLGQNISGVSELTVSGERGTVIQLIHAEKIHPNGHSDLSNIDVHYRPTDDTDPFQTDIFILSGNGTETFRPSFNYKGFQYVEVKSSKPILLTKSNLSGYFMHSAVPPVGSIKSDDELINKIWDATNNAYLSNLFGYPTDCPQREKNGWTGDAIIALETGLYNFDGITVYEKWLADHRDEQQPNGVLPAIIPTSGWGYQWANGPDWTSTIAIIPWKLYEFYGDLKPLKDNYTNIKAYVDHINDRYPTGLTTWGLGDWVPVKSKSPVELTSSIYYYADALILAKAAALLQKEKDAATYYILAEKIKTAINQKYLNTQTGIYGTGLQTELSVPVYWGVVPDDMKAKVVANLANRVQQDGVQLDVGILGAKAVLNVLSENGYADLAYQLASRKKYPSWGWWIENGATTLYENWKVDAKNDASLNHIMFGDIGAWFYKALGGIFPDENSPGFKNILLKPNFVEELNTFSASYKSVRGLIQSSWKKNKKGLEYTIVLPFNSTADFTIPKGWALKKSSESIVQNNNGSYKLPSRKTILLLQKNL